MKVQVVSDLHLEFHNPIPPLVEGVDVAVCAGDLAPIETGAVFYLAKEWSQAKHILYVPGNHEYYGEDIDAARQTLDRQCRYLGITLLDPGSTTIDGVRFIGATLWTDFELEGLVDGPRAHRAIGENMSDFTGAILKGRRRFTTHDSAELHRTERAFIEAGLARANDAGETAIVITHHAPTPRSIGRRFGRHPLNPGFASDLERVIERYQPRLWIHGHMHDPVDVMLGDTRVLCNPQGYTPERDTHRGYDPGLCIGISP